MKKRKLLALALSAAMTVTILGGCGTSTPETSAAASTEEPVTTAATTAAATSTAETTAAPETKAAQKSYPLVTEDKENQEQYAVQETGAAAKFEWYKWEFEIDPEIDTVGEIGDGALRRYSVYPGRAAAEQFPGAIQNSQPSGYGNPPCGL